MSLIEKAAQRLAELQRAGAELPGKDSSSSSAPTSAETAENVPTPEAMVRQFHARKAETSPTLESADSKESIAAATSPAGTNRVPSRVTAEIDLVRLKGLGFVTPDTPQSAIAHELRVLKRPILRNAQGRSGSTIANGTLVMVASALPGEGKTFTAINLAISMAMEVDNSVLLVDGDVAHPTVFGVLGLPPSPGLLDLLTRDDLDIDDVLLQTNVERLMLMPAGTRHRQATELLASERMEALLRDLVGRYPNKMIIFDSPPLLATTEAPALAAHMGQIVMVVAADSTSRHAVNQALATIERCEVVLMMLNKAADSDVSTYYGYYADDVPA